MSLPPPSAKTAIVVTGASSGIGTELARGLARRGYPLLLVARRRERLEELADEVHSTHSVAAEVMALDLADAGARAQLSERIGNEPVAGVCNSAGFGTSGQFCELPIEREREEVVVNVFALMELTHAALPGMIARGAGAVLNVASIAGFQPMPHMAVYSASKAFVQTFSEAVHEELHGTGVSCTVLCPGPVPTEWADIADAHQYSIGIAQVSARHVAEDAIHGMLAGKRSVIPGLVPKAASLGGRFTPRGVLLPALRLGRQIRG
ncbi:MAG TPA: SDR family oxidoreductase [Mycobacterium sp.]|nr:SDR family oxidoreductase [Mycobacterium sp.]